MKNKSILLVSDSGHIKTIIANTLSDTEFNLIVISEYEDTLEFINNFNNKIDLIIIGIKNIISTNEIKFIKKLFNEDSFFFVMSDNIPQDIEIICNKKNILIYENLFDLLIFKNNILEILK